MNITAASCVFPSGPGIDLADVALRATLALNRKHPFYVDRSGNPVRASYFPEPKLFDVTRWIALAQAALHDLHRQLPAPDPRAQDAPSHDLWLALPPTSRPGVPANLAEQLFAAVRNGPFLFNTAHLTEGGHAAPVVALHQAGKSLGTKHAAGSKSAIVLAVDSWLHPDALTWLEGEDLLHNAGRPYHGQTHRNPYGCVPGEAAAAVMLSHSGMAWCQIKGAGAAAEPVLRTDPRPCTGLGWTQAAKQALETLPNEQKITHVVSDLNGEPYRADQFGFTALRIADRLVDDWQPYTPALVSGDVGSATALVQVALSANLLRQQEPGQAAQTHLLLSSSDDSLRAALVLAC